MKRIACEMCGSPNMIKKDGVYVCENCGCKYSIEEAKKLIVEFNSPVKVIVDNTKTINNALINARRAKQGKDWDTADTYYKMVIREQADNIESLFYIQYIRIKTIFGQATSLHALPYNDLRSAFEMLIRAISMIPAHYDAMKVADRNAVIEGFGYDLFDLTQTRIGAFTLARQEHKLIKLYRQMMYSSYQEFERALRAIIVIEDQAYLHRLIAELYRCYSNNRYAAKTKQDIGTELGLAQTVGKRRYIDFWAAHEDYRGYLEQEIEKITHEVTDLEEKRAHLPEQAEVARLGRQIKDTIREKQSISVLKKAERKEVARKIEQLEAQYKAAQWQEQAAVKDYDNKIYVRENKIAELKWELSKER